MCEQCEEYRKEVEQSRRERDQAIWMFKDASQAAFLLRAELKRLVDGVDD